MKPYNINILRNPSHSIGNEASQRGSRLASGNITVDHNTMCVYIHAVFSILQVCDNTQNKLHDTFNTIILCLGILSVL